MFPSVFRDVVHRYASIKQKTIRGDNVSFLTKQLKKAIMDRFIIKLRYLK